MHSKCDINYLLLDLHYTDKERMIMNTRLGFFNKAVVISTLMILPLKIIAQNLESKDTVPITIQRMNAKVEFDPYDSGPKVDFKNLVNFDFNGLKVRSISKNELAKRYLRAVRLKSDKSKSHLQRYNELKKIK